jgi:alpha-methylacyl-CoA racemase
MLLSDMGADLVRIVRPGTPPAAADDFVLRGRPAVEIDIRTQAGQAQALAMLASADALLEGNRPGVMERNGLGPDVVLARNPRLVYGRMTGWGQEGPLAMTAGHDINYISLTGALGAIGTAESPVPPLNLVGDYGGGSTYLVMGMLAALLEARTSGQGQVVDAAMCDGVASLMTLFYSKLQQGTWQDQRGVNFIGGSHFYGVYRCSDDRHVAVGPVEPQFYAIFRDKLGLTDADFDLQRDAGMWPELRRRVAAVFATRTRDEWCAVFEGSDACVTPVLSMTESPSHPHLRARGTFTVHEGLSQPAPAPRFSRTPSAIRENSTTSVEAVQARWTSS